MKVEKGSNNLSIITENSPLLIAPFKSNNIIQDLTYVMILKDFKKNMTIEKPKNYDRNEFICSYDSGECFKRDKKLWSKEKLISYGKLPNNKYMINWPINGNDYYSNSIEMTAQERLLSYDRAKQKSLRFLYFIQTELGFNNLSIDYSEYPTKDGFPLMPYHRESRRLNGKITLTLNDIKSPFFSFKSVFLELILSKILISSLFWDRCCCRWHECQIRIYTSIWIKC